MSRRLLFGSLLGLIWAVFATALHPPLHGQSLAGLAAIGGTVVDASGAVVPGASVTVFNRQIGLERKVATTDVGYFLVPSLPPASGYEVLVEKQGFAPYRAQDVQLQVGQSLSITARLEVAQQT